QHLGSTAIKTDKLIDTAMDGVLFIDEAYTLIQTGLSPPGGRGGGGAPPLAPGPPRRSLPDFFPGVGPDSLAVSRVPRSNGRKTNGPFTSAGT
ncbi:hypothetical protein, partial [Nocardia cyriacigeorgica]|uniref:hypothetical protein n=1 Tax=Nocardia cyriacigeorgica TaxID=135487 RepID=UPI002458CC31